MPSVPPKTRTSDYDRFQPTVHWAHLQQVPSTPGQLRRIYDYEIMYVYAGEMRVHFAEPGDTVVYRPGDLLYLNAGEYHRIEIASAEGARLLGIHFDFYDDFEVTSEYTMVVDEQNPNEALFSALPVNADGERLFRRKYASVDDEVVSWMERVCEEFTFEKTGFRLAGTGALLLALAAISRLNASPNRRISPAYRDDMDRLVEDLHSGMERPWTNALMAERLNISEDHFIRLFKEQYGMTPNRYVQKIRHHEAKRCLRETDMKIEWIGRKVGYEDLHHFSHAFKRWNGISPREYRKMRDLL